MKAPVPVSTFACWRNEQLYNIDFASYTLEHHSFPRHFHDHYVIELVLSGADSFYCNGKNYLAESDQLVLINPGEMHTGATPENNPLHYFSFYPEKSILNKVAAALEISLPENFCFSSTLQEPGPLTQKLRSLYHSIFKNTDMLLQQELFFECMGELLQHRNRSTAVKTNNDTRISTLIDYLRTNFRENITLQQMAAEVSINPFYMVRLFKKSTGVSPHEYLLILRTDHARQLLHNGCRVEEAALASGFYDTSHLNRSFRKIAGTSPKSFLLPKGQFYTSFHG